MPYEEDFEKNKKYKKRYEKLVSEQAFNKEYIKGIKGNVLGDVKQKNPKKILKALYNKSKTYKNDKWFSFLPGAEKKIFNLIGGDLDELLRKMKDGIPQEKEKKYKDIKSIDKLYKKTIADCTEYIVKYCNFTMLAESRNKKYLVQYLLNYCNKERSIFKEKALETLSGLNGHSSTLNKWSDILSNARIEHIDITDRGDLGKEGAATSEILTIGEGEDMKFFKDEEKLMSAYETMDKLFPSVADFLDENDKKFLRSFVNATSGVDYNYITDKIKGMGGQKPKEILEYIFAKILEYKNLDKINALSEIQANQVLEMMKSIGASELLFRVATIMAKIPNKSIISNRNVASSRMADLLGLGDIIAKSKKAKIKEAGKKSRVGNLMDKAKGIPVSKLFEMKENAPSLEFHISPNAKKQLMALQVLDTICGQIDRNLGNYFVTITEKDNDVTIDSIQGIDNDLSFGNLQLKTIGRSQLPAFIDNEGQTTFNHMDKDLAEKVLGLPPKTLKFIFEDLISKGEIESLIERLEVVKSAIRKSDKSNSEFLKGSEFFEKASPKELVDKDSYISALCRALEIKD